MKINMLDKLTVINRIAETRSVDLELARELCEAMADELESFVLLIDDKGKVLDNIRPLMDENTRILFEENEGESVDEKINERLLRILSVDDNMSLELLGLSGVSPFKMMVVPILAERKRCATLVIYRLNEKYDLDDIIYVEHVKVVMAVIFGSIELEKRKKLAIDKANLDKGLVSLSKAELAAAGFVLDSLLGEEGIVVAKEVSRRYEVSRSVIVAALKKLEGAGVIECRSVGSRGTYIKIVNDFLRDSIDTLRQEK